jgi:ADP-heptose:LPS heptosyltransferase
MQSKKINYDYLKIAKEMPLLLRASLIRKKSVKHSGRALIVNTCLIGDFVASLPAISSFIKNSGEKIDLVVSPTVRPLAERIRGVRKVFAAKSIYSRNLENFNENSPELGDYDYAIVLRTGSESYNIIKRVNAGEVKTSFIPVVKYTFHLLRNNGFGKTPKQWRELNFEILNQKEKNIKFEEIFDFTDKDYKKIDKIKEMKTKEKIIILHAGSEWIMKKWPNDKWAELIKKINSLGKFRFIFVGTNGEEEDYEAISKKLGFKVYSLIGKTDITELMLILRQSNYFIGIDSGPRNMAHLAGLRSIVLLGPGPHMFMPGNSKDIVIDKSNGKGIYQRFFYKKNSFIDMITVGEVYDSFKELADLKEKTNVKKK